MHCNLGSVTNIFQRSPLKMLITFAKNIWFDMHQFLENVNILLIIISLILLFSETQHAMI